MRLDKRRATTANERAGPATRPVTSIDDKWKKTEPYKNENEGKIRYTYVSARRVECDLFIIILLSARALRSLRLRRRDRARHKRNRIIYS